MRASGQAGGHARAPGRGHTHSKDAVHALAHLLVHEGSVKRVAKDLHGLLKEARGAEGPASPGLALLLLLPHALARVRGLLRWAIISILLVPARCFLLILLVLLVHL